MRIIAGGGRDRPRDDRSYVLAGELHRAAGDVPLALRRYHDKLGRFVAGQQRKAITYRSFFVPESRLGVAARNLTTKIAALPGLTKLAAGRAGMPFQLDSYEL